MALLLSMAGMQAGLASEFQVAEETMMSPFTGSISLDVNPSIELMVENGTVTQALAYNDDGHSLLEGSDLTGLTAEEAVKAMTRALVEGGYLAPSLITPYLVITVSGSGTPEGETAEALQNAAKQVAEELGAEFEIKSAFVSDEVAAQAAAAGLSAGKYLLMQYVAQAEGITLEEAIANYGTVSIGELLSQFEDADEVFEIGELLLAEEQLAALDAAFALQKESIIAAEKAFHDAFKALKSTYRDKAHSITKAKKEVYVQALTDALSQLKEQFLAEYQAVRQAFDDAVSVARAAFLEAVTLAGIPEEMTGQYTSWHINKQENPEGELNAFLKEFTYKAKGNDKDKGKKDEVPFVESKATAPEEEALSVQNKQLSEVQGNDNGNGKDADKDQGKGKDDIKGSVEVKSNSEDKGNGKDENKGQGQSDDKSSNGKSDKGKK